jgi:Flp pilus assembly protein TadD
MSRQWRSGCRIEVKERIMPLPIALRACASRSHAWLIASSIALAMAACTNQPLLEPAPIVPTASDASNPAEKPKPTQKPETKVASAALLAKAQADPKDTMSVIQAARALRTEGERAQALVLLEKATIAQPKNLALIRETGLISLELGQIGKAETLLAKALEHNTTDWQTRSALGAALASGGKHQEAQKHFAKALELAPDHPAILNNLGLSYALDGKPAEAERVLRIAASAKASPPHVKQNLALMLSAGGKLAEAEKLAQGTPVGNAAYLKMLAERANTDRPLKSAEIRRGDLSSPYGLGVSTKQ